MNQNKEETKQFLVRTPKKIMRITVPPSWKVTFGPTGPPRDRHNPDFDGRQRGWVLRFYEAENRQRACFTNVIEFYDLSLPIEVLVMANEGGQSGWVRAEHGFADIPKEMKKKVHVLAEAVEIADE